MPTVERLGCGADIKAHREATHRAKHPQETLAELAPLLGRFGITRVAVVTGLDRLGIPVVMVTRPLARNMSVTQGKGLTLAAAKVSGIMEAVEHYHAESIELPLRLATEESLPDSTVKPSTLGARHAPSHEDASLLWLRGESLVDGAPVWVPYDAVHLDFRSPGPTGRASVPPSSNGLASGNNVGEATCHALLELFERHLTELFYELDLASQERRRLRLSSVTAPLVLQLFEQLSTVGVELTVWDISGELGVPCFFCELLDREPDPFRGIPRARGIGCHTDKEVALLRAITEAAQSRLTLISGARDDIQEFDVQTRHKMIRDAHEQQRVRSRLNATRDYSEAPSLSFETFSAETAWLVRTAREAGLGDAIRVDLSKPELPISVVRVILPGARASRSGALRGTHQ